MRMSLRAMQFAYDAHKDQKRKYTNQPYFCHLAEVVGIVSTVNDYDTTLAIAWLHDTVEDTPTTIDQIAIGFDECIANGVWYLTDSTEGNRETRKRADRERLFHAPEYVQNVKLADLISNTASIFQFDPNFGKVYGKEKREMLNVLLKANKHLRQIANEQLKAYGY